MSFYAMIFLFAKYLKSNHKKFLFDYKSNNFENILQLKKQPSFIMHDKHDQSKQN